MHNILETTSTTEQMNSKLSDFLKAEGYEIIRILVNGNIRKTLQIMIDRLDGQIVTVTDCEKVSRLVSPVLDVYNFISDAYNLEVSSPGMDRPLTKPDHFIRFVGEKIMVQTSHPVGKSPRIRHKGVLEFASEKGITVDTYDEKNENFKLELKYDTIKSARLIPSYE
ncbi:MAG: ribosome maturation factor RimP [Candidatus Pelagibacter sp.]|nr:ribosome maturation factor RimP [Candidatus Pelagibacter sp.]